MIDNEVYYAGASRAARDALDVSILRPGNKFRYPNGDVDEWTGSAWVNIVSGGAASVASAPMESGPIYEDATYMYFAQAIVSNPASELSDAVWQVSRMHSTSKRVEYATGASFSHAYTDLSAAQAAFA